MGRRMSPLLRIGLASLSALWMIPLACAQEPSNDDRIQRKVAVIELSRSIRSYTVSTLTTADCLVEQGRLSRREADQAIPIQLREVGISSHVLTNPQVLKARDQLLPLMDSSCSLSTIDAETARRVVEQEL